MSLFQSSSNRLETLLTQAVTVQSNGIKKSASDEREYRSVTLTNSLEALLISDSKTDNAAAALSVNVGSYSDPPELPGLAHFLEHMLFMGTEKFPDENEYSEFLSKHGGYSNAYTASEYTNYHFQVMPSELFNALDRFSAFFVKPLFTEGGTERELNAVDNECSGNDQNDAWRTFLIYRELANPEHPIHKFNIGNLATLKHEPEKKGISVREALFKFYDTYYSANRMRLVVVGKESLDILQGYVEKLFTDVPNKNIPTPYKHPDPAGPAFSKELGNLQKKVFVLPVKDVRKIEIMWIMPPSTLSNRRKEACSYLGSLFGDEGEGSILSYLKKKNWANALSAGMSDNNFDLSAFEVSVYCTDLGITSHLDEIVDVVYTYANMLREKFRDQQQVEYFFEEEKISSAISFWFKNKSDPMSTATNLAATLQDHELDVKDVLVNGLVRTEDTFPVVKEALDMLIPENSAIFVLWKGNEKLTVKEETYFKTKFAVVDIEPTMVNRWKECNNYEELGLAITPPNKFIPKKFEILSFKKPQPSKLADSSSNFLKDSASSKLVELIKHLNHSDIQDKKSLLTDVTTRDLTEVWEEDTFRKPLVVSSDSSSTLWFKQDTSFKRPKSIVRMFVKNPRVNESVQMTTIFQTFILLVKEELNEKTYAAQSVGFNHDISLDANGIIFGFSGFSETIHKYIELVAMKFKEMAIGGVTNVDSFNRIKESRLKALKNYSKERPIKLARDIFSELTQEKKVSMETRIRVFQELSLGDISKTTPTFMESTAVEVFVTGNAVQEDAMNCLDIARKVFNPSRDISFHEHSRVLCLRPEQGPPTQVYHLESSRNPDNTGSALFVSFDFGEKTYEKLALLYLFNDTCHERFFNQLRTKQQLGYIVQSGFGLDSGILSLGFYVQSNNTDPIQINFRVEEFLDNFLEDFITEEVFQKVVNAELNGLWKKPNSIVNESGLWFRSIQSGLYTFDNKMQISKALAHASLEDLKQLLSNYLWKNAPYRSKFVGGILSDVHGCKLFGDKYILENKRGIENGCMKGFDAGFVQTWLEKDPESYKNFCLNRGNIVVAEDLQTLKERMPFYPNMGEITAKL